MNAASAIEDMRDDLRMNRGELTCDRSADPLRPAMPVIMDTADWDRFKLALRFPMQDEVDAATSKLREVMVNAYLEYVDELRPSESIGPEVFVRIASCSFVREHSKRLHLSPCHRSWIRAYIAKDVDVTYITLGFWRDDGLAQQSVEDLLDSAKRASDPAAKRVVAIRTLIRHFPWHLNEDERLNSMDYKGYEVPQKDGQVGAFFNVNVIAYWEEKACRIQAEGVVLDHVCVCCNAKVCAALNRCCEPCCRSKLLFCLMLVSMRLGVSVAATLTVSVDASRSVRLDVHATSDAEMKDQCMEYA